MVQCPEAHLFCADCVVGYAKSKLGEQTHQIQCMDQAGCSTYFNDSELQRVLPPKLLQLYERVRQRRDVEAAGIDGLEECPFCDFKIVIEQDVETEKLFRCQNEDCCRVSCRKCKKEVIDLRGSLCEMIPNTHFRITFRRAAPKSMKIRSLRAGTL